MNKEEFRALLVQSLKDTLSPVQQSELNSYLEQHPEDAEELNVLKEVWQQAEMNVPAPSESMDDNFYKMLAEKTKEVEKKRSSDWVSRLALMLGKFSYAFIALIAFSAGIIFQGQMKGSSEVSLLTQEVQQMRKMMMLTLIEQPAAQDRIKAVSMVEEINNSDEKVIMALLKTLNEDPNVNVRLAVVEVLGQKKLNAAVRSDLVKSIATQEHPLVQAAMADLMVLIQEKSSIKALEELLLREDLNPLVKDKIDESLEILS